MLCQTDMKFDILVVIIVSDIYLIKVFLYSYEF